MTSETLTLVFWFILDPITFGLGSIGAYQFFTEISSLDHVPSLSELLSLSRERWAAILALSIAILYFLFRLYVVIHRAG